MRRLLARESINTTERNVLVTHRFYSSGGKLAEEMSGWIRDADWSGNIDQIRTDMLSHLTDVAMGHIRRPMQVRSKSGACTVGRRWRLFVSEAGGKGNPYGRTEGKRSRAKDHSASAPYRCDRCGGEAKPDRGIAAGLWRTMRRRSF
ncbi:MAG: hypothetical protein ACLTSZ_13680 [Lachnospiraceae bacterium]